MPQARSRVERLVRYNGRVCTVTWHDAADRYHVFFNRDERRERKPGLPPGIRRRGPTRFIAPLDGDFGGTWIAVNEFGLTVCLVNGFPAAGGADADSDRTFTSRGHLPLLAIEHSSTPAVSSLLHSFDLRSFRPFVLVTFETGGAGLVARWSGVSLDIRAGRPTGQPLVSSSFYTEEVRRNRTAVYRQLAHEHEGLEPTSLHFAFHRSHLPVAGPHSPCMHRPDACTVSFSHVRVDRSDVRLGYSPHPPCRGLPEGSGVVLVRRPAG